jgi:hypothetical protein
MAAKGQSPILTTGNSLRTTAEAAAPAGAEVAADDGRAGVCRSTQAVFHRIYWRDGTSGPKPGRWYCYAKSAYGTGRVTLSQGRDGWEGNWDDGQGHLLIGPSPATFPDILEWARRLPAPEILILTGYGPVRE